MNGDNNVHIQQSHKKNTSDEGGVAWDHTHFAALPVAKTENDPIQLMEVPSFVSLAHELQHVKNYLSKMPEMLSKLPNGEMYDKRSEESAMLMENYVRQEHNLPLRSYYLQTNMNRVYWGPENSKAPMPVPKSENTIDFHIYYNID